MLDVGEFSGDDLKEETGSLDDGGVERGRQSGSN